MDWGFVYGMREVLSGAFLCKAMVIATLCYMAFQTTVLLNYNYIHNSAARLLSTGNTLNSGLSSFQEI